VKLIFDHNLSKYMAHSLSALFHGEHEITSIEDKFGTGDIPDLDWMPKLGDERDWCIISGDVRISKNKIEAAAFRKANLVGFFLSPALRKKSILLQTARILQIWDKLEAQSKLTRPGLFELTERGAYFRQIGR
jgi:PIN like domain